MPINKTTLFNSGTDVYGNPSDVMRDDNMSQEQKNRTLESWGLGSDSLTRAGNQNARTFGKVRSQESAGVGKLREAVAIFNNREALDSAVSELEITAFPRHSISVLGGQRAVEKVFGRLAPRTQRIADHPKAPRSAAILPEERALGAAGLTGGFAYLGGCIVAIAANGMSDHVLLASIAAGSLSGGLIGFAIAMAIRQVWLQETRRQINQGGLALWVHTPDPETEILACDILRRHGGTQIHIHEI